MGRHAGRRGVLLVGAAWWSLLGCGGVESTTGTGGSGGGTTSGSGGTGGTECLPDEEPAFPSDDWCARFVAGPAGARSAPVDWSTTHAHVRFFGAVESYAQADQALAAAFASDAAFEGQDVSAYTAALPGIACAGVASDVKVGPAKVTLVGETAVIEPGAGTVELPAGTTAVLVDLRGVPEIEGAREAIVTAISPALATPIGGLLARVRKHDGMVDEVFSANNVYKQSVAVLDVPEIPATGAADLPIGLLTSAELSSAATELALAMRLANRAWIIGEGLRTEVAEARWYGIASQGVAARYRDLYLPGGTRLPDALEADFRTPQPVCYAPQIATLGTPPAPVLGPASRPKIASLTPFDDTQPGGDALGDARASLVISHGAARLFYPYFATVGDGIDARLEEVVSALPAAPSRADHYQALRRLGEALVDGHQFVFDANPGTAGYLPLYVEDIDGAPVIRRSAAPGILPGDTITAMDGVPAADWYATELARSGGATPGYKFNIATRQLLAMKGPVTLDLVDAAGTAKTVTAQPQPVADYLTVLVATSRPAGYLTDLGAPELYYLNLDGSVADENADVTIALTEAQGAKGLVVDMRGYPGIDHYSVARRLIQKTFSTPSFGVPVLTGPDDKVLTESASPLSPIASLSFSGPIALLVGHSTVSAAENFSIMLVDAERVTVVGRTSAGTNGNITGVQLPSDFTFTFTGMEVRHADAGKSVFHGVGIVPDIDVPLTAADFANGDDPELEAAISWLLVQ